MKNNMKKVLLTSSLATSVIAVPIVFSVVSASTTENYKDFAKASQYKELNTNEYNKGNLSSYLKLSATDFRKNEYKNLTMIEPTIVKDIDNYKPGYSPLKLVSKNEVLHYTNGNAGQAIQESTNAVVLQNEVHTVYITGDYSSLFTTNELINLLSESISDSLNVTQMLRTKNINISFTSKKGARSVSGNSTDNVIQVSINSNSSKTKIKSLIYYVLQHELMHDGLNNISMKGNLLFDSDKARNGSTSQEDIYKAEDKYAELTERPGLSDLSHQLLENKFMAPSISNVYLGNIQELKEKYGNSISGNFDSEIVHLYTLPKETIVEDLLSMSIGGKYSDQVNSKFAGLIGSLGFRIGHNVSLLNLTNRAEVYKKLMHNLYCAAQFSDDIYPVNSIESGSLTKTNYVYTKSEYIQSFNRLRIGFFSNHDLAPHLKGKVFYSTDSKVPPKMANIETYKTKVFMRKSPFSKEAINYGMFYNQITIPLEKVNGDYVNINEINFDFKKDPAKFSDIAYSKLFMEKIMGITSTNPHPNHEYYGEGKMKVGRIAPLAPPKVGGHA